MVNDNLKANARSNAYQAALLPYRPSEVSAEDIKERMIRDYIRLGIPEDTARKQVEALLAASGNATEQPTRVTLRHFTRVSGRQSTHPVLLSPLLSSPHPDSP
jgi:hypothetical protein